jgi:hypothetical protein
MERYGHGKLRREGQVWGECMWVLLMWAPSGRLTAMMFAVGLIPRRLLEILKKCPVAPESIIIGGEGEDILEELSWLIVFMLLA